MARTIGEIHDSIIAEKQSLASLDNLLPEGSQARYLKLLETINSNSKVAIWRLIVYIVAVAHQTLEKLWDYAKQELNLLAEQSIAGNLQWYKNQVLKFQYNHLLLWNSDTFRYYYQDTTSQDAIDSKIIKRASCVEIFTKDFRGVMVKVAKENSGVLEPLTLTEADALNSYIDRVKFAGVQTDVISQDADKLKLNAKIYYDGTLDEAETKENVENAVKNYLNNIEFDGTIYLIKLIDAIQEVKGVRDIVVINAEGGNYLNQFQSFNKEYDTESGWILYDDNSTLQMIKE